MSDDDLKKLLRERVGFGRDETRRKRGDLDLNPHLRKVEPGTGNLKPAAVLIPIIVRAEGLHVLFTRRADHLARHAGQVSFPGGRVNDDDANVIEAALRETEEEVGLPRSFVDVFGDLDTYETGTGFSIQPVVGFVSEGFNLTIDPAEVAEAFEVPLRFLLNRDNHEQRTGTWQGTERRYYAMTYGRHYIWGATAGILMNLHQSLYG
jgi:8-oxo-dGTP pyrophosphatase MutT (NUDIX family)